MKLPLLCALLQLLCIMPAQSESTQGERLTQDYFVRQTKKLRSVWKWDKELPDQATVANFLIRKEGTVGAIQIRQSSKNSEFDDAAVAAIKLAIPFDPLPQDTDLVNGQAEFGKESTMPYVGMLDVEHQPYVDDIQERVKRNPLTAGTPGTSTTVRFTIQSSGEVTDIRVSTPSGNALQDQAAMKAVKAASPFGPLPTGSPPTMEMELVLVVARR